MSGTTASGTTSGRTPDPAHLVVLAGGTGRRLGGVDKAALVLDGVPLLDRVLQAAAGAGHVVVVGPQRPLTAPTPVIWTVEDPPQGGPLAGLAAGVMVLAALAPEKDPWVLVLACDQPHAADAVPTLLTAIAHSGRSNAILGRDMAGRDQPLLAAYKLAALHRVLQTISVHGTPMRALLDRLDVAMVDLPDGTSSDVDTWQDADTLGVTAMPTPPGQDITPPTPFPSTTIDKDPT